MMRNIMSVEKISSLPVQGKASQEFKAENPSKRPLDNRLTRLAEKIFIDHPILSGVVLGALCVGTVGVVSVFAFPLVPIIGAVALGILFGGGLCCRPWLRKNILQRDLQSFDSKLGTMTQQLNIFNEILSPKDQEELKEIAHYQDHVRTYKFSAAQYNKQLNTFKEKSLDDFKLNPAGRIDEIDNQITFIESSIGQAQEFFANCRMHMTILDSHREEIEADIKSLRILEQALTQLSKDPIHQAYFEKHYRENEEFNALMQRTVFVKAMMFGGTRCNENYMKTKEEYPVFYKDWQQQFQLWKNEPKKSVAAWTKHFANIRKCIELNLDSLDDAKLLAQEKVYQGLTRAEFLLQHHEYCTKLKSELETVKNSEHYQAFKEDATYQAEINSLERDLDIWLNVFKDIKHRPLKIREDYSQCLQKLEFQIQYLKDYCEVAYRGIQQGVWAVDKFLLNRDGQDILVKAMTQSTYDEVVKLNRELQKYSTSQLPCKIKTLLGSLKKDMERIDERRDDYAPLIMTSVALQDRECQLRQVADFARQIDYMRRGILNMPKKPTSLLSRVNDFYNSSEDQIPATDILKLIYEDFLKISDDQKIKDLFSEHPRLQEIKDALEGQYKAIFNKDRMRTNQECHNQSLQRQWRNCVFRFALLCLAVKKEPQLRLEENIPVSGFAIQT